MQRRTATIAAYLRERSGRDPFVTFVTAGNAVDPSTSTSAVGVQLAAGP